MTKYILCDGDSGVTQTIKAADLEEARAAAHEWAREGDWDTSDGTVWVDVYIRDADGDEVERVTTAIDPEEPECTDDRTEHEWHSPIELVGGVRENPGVYGHGGGVTMTACCRYCGCRRFTDTWAQRPDTGEQGLESVAYTPGHWSEDDLAEVWPPEESDDEVQS